MVSNITCHRSVSLGRNPRKTTSAVGSHQLSLCIMTKQVDTDVEMRLSEDFQASSRGTNPVLEDSSPLSSKAALSQTSDQQPTVATDLRAYAARLVENGEVSSAEEIFRHVLHILSQTPSSPEIEIVETLRLLGKCCQLSGRPEEAMRCYKEVLQLKARQRLQDEPAPMKLILAEIFYAMGMIHSKLYMESRRDVVTKAIKCFSFSIELRKGCLGERHPTIASAQHNIATILVKAGHFHKSLEYYNASLANRRVALGRHHPEVASSLRHIAMAHRSMGNNNKAASSLSEALEILKCIPFESSLGEVMIELSHVKRTDNFGASR